VLYTYKLIIIISYVGGGLQVDSPPKQSREMSKETHSFRINSKSEHSRPPNP